VNTDRDGEDDLENGEQLRYRADLDQGQLT
jgi:hypothetical protein